jgi:hypothetical protein
MTGSPTREARNQRWLRRSPQPAARISLPPSSGCSPVPGHTFMLFVGIVEMAAAVLVAVRPRIGAYVVVVWLLGIIVNLLLIPGYFDVALRDFGLALGALALARLSEEFTDVRRTERSL